MMQKNWMLGFFGFMAVREIQGLLAGNYLEAIWLIWLVWFIYFIPKKS